MAVSVGERWTMAVFSLHYLPTLSVMRFLRFSQSTRFSKSESHCKLRPNARKGLSPLLPQLSPPPASPPFVHPPTHPPPSRSSLPLPHPPRAPGWQFSGGTINGSPVLNQSPSCPSPSRPPERVLCNGQFTVSSLWVM